MSDLRQYLFKNVVIEDINGNIHKGYVDLYESDLDSGNDEEYIGLIPDSKDKLGIGLYQSEIKSIALI